MIAPSTFTDRKGRDWSLVIDQAAIARAEASLPLSALGQAMWVRSGVFVMLAIRRVSGVGFGRAERRS